MADKTTTYILTSEDVAEAIRNFVRASYIDDTVDDGAEVVVRVDGVNTPVLAVSAIVKVDL